MREICSALKPLLWMSVYREGNLSSLGHETAAPPAVRALRSYVCCSHIPMWKGVSWCHRAPRGDPAGRVGTDQPSVVQIWGRVAASWCKCKGGVLSQAHGEGLRPGCWKRVASQFLSLPEGRRIRPWRAASLSPAPTQPACCRICVSKPTTWPHPLGQGALCHLWSTGHRSLGCRWSVYGHGPGSQTLVLPEWFDGGIRSPPFC